MATFEVSESPPPELDASLLTGPRDQTEGGLLIRAFSLFRFATDEDDRS